LKGALLHKGDVPHTGQPEVGSIIFTRLLTSHREAMCNMLMPATQIVLFHKIHVFSISSEEGIFLQVKIFSHFKTFSDCTYSFQKLTQSSQVNNVLDFPA
jgi:hypothetical protein